MLSVRSIQRAAIGAAATLVAGTVGAVGASAAEAPAQAAACGVMFDDFHYDSAADPDLAAHGWTVRTSRGGPGVPGASWLASNVSFPANDGERVLQLRLATDGTAAGTSQAELYHQRKFADGTYAARVRFSDAPASGGDGDHVVQTFFTITPLEAPLDPDYGELDFEYLPNGGWGVSGPILYQVTWETYQGDPWIADNISNSQSTSHDGWHDLVIQVAGGARGGVVKYFVDGQRVAQHTGRYYPETPMSINFNHWLIDLTGHTGGTSVYLEQVDWVYFAENKLVAPGKVSDRVAGYRSSGVAHIDSVGAEGTCRTKQP